MRTRQCEARNDALGATCVLVRYHEEDKKRPPRRGSRHWGWSIKLGKYVEWEMA